MPDTPSAAGKACLYVQFDLIRSNPARDVHGKCSHANSRGGHGECMLSGSCRDLNTLQPDGNMR